MEELTKKFYDIFNRTNELYKASVDVVAELNAKLNSSLRADICEGHIVIVDAMLGEIMNETVEDLYIDMQRSNTDYKGIIIKTLSNY
ncbi:hypothetical protein ABHA39_04055 [Clostridium paraputrificum]|uniref:hypothetical protein n=1 Tax=Clostridium paraputrificum TaxID=29363 RepID=UPI00232B5CF1|nr:hypothetical protein [Clostridium paraputrificum]MDB2071388.1 hypothetical protein [Clostridium paraputrificum]MDB2081699.1 hypothetical protein [Clostridium paraputrificum]